MRTKLLTVQQLADILGYKTRNSVYNNLPYMKTRGLEVVDINGTLRIKESSIDTFLSNCEAFV